MGNNEELAPISPLGMLGITASLNNVEHFPVALREPTNLAKHTVLPLSSLPALGVAFEPLAAAFQQVAEAGGAKGGLCWVDTNGGTLAAFKDGSGLTGSVLKSNGAVGGGQARINPLTVNPTMLFMAVALANIDKKLDAIQETQQELLNFLVQKERSELKGDLNVLVDTLNNYRFNWNNEKFITSRHMKVLDIKQAAERKIDFYRVQISSKLSKSSFFHGDQEVKKQLAAVQAEFKDYQLALYLFAYSSFLEVMLLENFNPAYLDGVTKKIKDYSIMYRELYVQCYNQIEGYAKSSIQSRLLDGLSNANSVAGEALARVPGVRGSQVDKARIEVGGMLGKLGSKRIEQTMEQLIEKESSCTRPFVESINAINRLHNQPVELLFDDENIYIGAA